MMIKFFSIKNDSVFFQLIICGLRIKYKKTKKISNKEIITILDTIKSEISNYIPQTNEQIKYTNLLVIQELKKLKHFYFLPNKGNLGDVVIANAEYQLFKDNNFNYTLFNPKIKLPYKHFNLVYGGGGIFTPHWDNKPILKILKNLNIKQSIILPSSFYQCEQLMTILDERFTVFCREKFSYKYTLSKNSKTKFYLANDMAFDTDVDFYNKEGFAQTEIEKLNDFIKNHYYKDIKYIYIKKYISYLNIYTKLSKGLEKIEDTEIKIGYFLRNDAESLIKDKTYLNIKSSIDLSSCGGSNSDDVGYVKILSQLFFAAIDCADIVITDRLHIGIPAALLNKEVFLLDNTYGKLKGVYQQSMKNIKNVHMIEIKDLQNINDIIQRNKINKLSNKINFLNMNIPFNKFLIKYIAYSNNKNSRAINGNESN